MDSTNNYCSNCGNSISNSSRFCSYCGFVTHTEKVEKQFKRLEISTQNRSCFVDYVAGGGYYVRIESPYFSINNGKVDGWFRALDPGTARLNFKCYENDNKYPSTKYLLEAATIYVRE